MEEFRKLVQLMERLRADDGCPWDRKQTTQSFKTFVLEEVYELIDAIDKEDYRGIKEELGDLLFHIVFIAQICRESGHFGISDVIKETYEKMYRRHPHVFLGAATDQPVETRWEELKKREKADYSLLSSIPFSVPALLRAYIISRRASRFGFDWEKIDDVYGKLFEEVDELRRAEDEGNIHSISEEIGDLLFTIVNIARFHSVDPEDALRHTNEKFIRRFGYIEKKLNGQPATATAMDKLWNEVKDIEKEGQ